MKVAGVSVLARVWVALLAGTASAMANQPLQFDPPPPPAQVSRGRYLVERVGLCSDCHSPRARDGRLDQTRWLQGARLEIKSVGDLPDWAETAPSIAGGVTGWTRTQLATFLETGRTPDGKPIRPPMPPYRFTHVDAVAVAAYLATLAPPAPRD